MNYSFWEQQSFLSGYDVIVAGSGIVGLSAALSLKTKSPNLNILVLERGILPSGASTRNAGVACFGTVSEIIEDLKHFSEDEVFGLVERRWRGLHNLRKLLGDEAIRFEMNGGYELFSNEETLLAEEALEKISFVNQSLSNILKTRNAYAVADKDIAAFGFKGMIHMIRNECEGQIHSGSMMSALLEKAQTAGVRVISGAKIESVDEEGTGVRILTEDGTIFKSKQALLATNGFSKALFPELDVNPARAQVVITSELDDLPFKGSFHFDKGYYYFRNIGKRVLFGGGRNLDLKTEETSEFGFTDIVQQKLETLLKENILPSKKYTIENRWSGIMGMGSRRVPILQAVSPHIFCAVRLSGMGVAIGTLVGDEAADLLQKNS